MVELFTQGQKAIGAGEMSTLAVPRLKREDCKRTKHDSPFSSWQVLIGASDWDDHALGKEGAERYRVYNLPKISCPGVYELAIAVSRTGLGRGIGKLDSDRIVVVYLGQADSVRTRLQCYGRSGAHLGNTCLTAHPNDSESILLPKGPGLFEEIFLRGYSIVYRWAPMKNKRDAEKTEAQLLNTFDYAWNRGSNGARRPNDILQKLNKVASITSQFSSIAGKLSPFSQKQVGIKINSIKLLSLKNKKTTYVDEENQNLLWRAFNFSRSRPRLVSDTSGGIENNTISCGVALGDGSVCMKAPVEGRKRCAGHKGLKLNGSIAKLINEGKSHVGIESFESSILDSRQSDNVIAHSYGYDPAKLPMIAGNYTVGEDFTPICGITLNDGSACRRQPVQGQKRCIEHKGRRIIKPNSESIERNSQHDVVLKSSSPDSLDYKQSSEICKPGEEQAQVSSERSVIDKHYDPICGVDLGYGIFCTSRPVKGGVRCEEHKGMRVNGLIPILVTEDKSHSKCSTYSDWRYSNTFVCGATTSDGSLCGRQPVEGNKRCWQHKGNRADSSFFSFETHTTLVTCGATTSDGSLCSRQPVEGNKRCWQHKGTRADSSFFSFETHRTLVTCGATTSDGSLCRRQPVEGNKRCWQHKGSRADSSFFSFETHRTLATCGVALRNGSVCMKAPVPGRKRCEQHKGMRV